MMGRKRPLGSKAGVQKPWCERDGVRLIILALLALVLTDRMVLASDDAPSLRCHGKDFVTLSDNGLLDKGDTAAVAQRADFTVDLRTGMLAYANEQGRQWVVLQKGDEQQDWVLAKPSMAEAYANNFVRLRVRKESKEIPFLMVSISSIISGTCSAVR